MVPKVFWRFLNAQDRFQRKARLDALKVEILTCEANMGIIINISMPR